jgi:hypothetical protein
MARVVSAAEIARQIRREGARHRLAPRMAYGQMTVAEETRERRNGPVVSVSVREFVSIRNVSMDSPLGLVAKSKKHRHQWNVLRLVRERRARLQDAAQQRYDLNRKHRSDEIRRVVRDVGSEGLLRAIWEVSRGRIDPR